MKYNGYKSLKTSQIRPTKYLTEKYNLIKNRELNYEMVGSTGVEPVTPCL